MKGRLSRLGLEDVFCEPISADDGCLAVLSLCWLDLSH